MFNTHKVLCVIPARGGSKGLPGKNIKLLAGKPLIAYSIERAKQSRYIDRVIVSTDDKEIAGVARRYGAEIPFIRPAHLALDHVDKIDVILHATDWLAKKEKNKYDILVCLHVTAPLRKPADIDNCIEMLVESKADNVFSVAEANRNPYFNMVEITPQGVVRLVKKGNFTSRQAAPKVYDLNASIYAWWNDVLKKKKKLITPKTRIYVMPRERSFDIDDELDFRITEFIKKSMKQERK